MTWRIPPLGLCAICLITHSEEVPARTMVDGTVVCREHARVVAPRLQVRDVPHPEQP